jgi:hypothetical protein
MTQFLRDKYFSRDETAVELDVSTRTLDRWWSQRVGPPRTKIGNQIFYRKAAVESWVAQQESAPIRARKAG